MLIFRPAILFLVASAAFPVRLFAGPGSWTSGGPFGGNVSAIGIDPSNVGTIYVTTAGNSDAVSLEPPNVFRSRDAGRSWAWISSIDYLDVVRCLAIDPADPNVVFAGGAFQFLYKSVDGGRSWKPVGQVPVDGGQTNLPGANSILFAPGNPSSILVSSGIGGGVFKSLDGGEIFVPSNEGLPDVSQCGGFANNLIADTRIPGTLYVSSCGDLYRSRDGGETWLAAGSGLPGHDIQSLAADPTNASTLYVATAKHGVFRSTDGGLNWVQRSGGLPTIQGFSLVANLLVDPLSPFHVYAGAGLAGLYFSSNAGTSWSSVAVAPVTALAASGERILVGTTGGVLVGPGIRQTWAPSSSGLHGIMTSAIARATASPGVFYAGTRGNGLHITRNAGLSWTPVAGIPSGADIGAIAIDPSSSDVLFVSQRAFLRFGGYTSALFKSADGGVTWKESDTGLGFGDLAKVEVDSAEHEVLFAANRGGGIYRSTDFGATWSFALGGSSFAIDAADPAIVYVVGNSPEGLVVHRSVDFGATWADFAGPPFLGWDNASISASGGFVYVAQTSGADSIDTRVHVDVSSDRGETWGRGGGADFPGFQPGGLVSLGAAGVAYVATNGGGNTFSGCGVFQTRDGGEHWIDVSVSLPDRSVYDLAAAADGNALHVATYTGIYDFEFARSSVRLSPTSLALPAPIGGGDAVRPRP